MSARGGWTIERHRSGLVNVVMRHQCICYHPVVGAFEYLVPLVDRFGATSALAGGHQTHWFAQSREPVAPDFNCPHYLPSRSSFFICLAREELMRFTNSRRLLIFAALVAVVNSTAVFAQSVAPDFGLQIDPPLTLAADTPAQTTSDPVTTPTAKSDAAPPALPSAGPDRTPFRAGSWALQSYFAGTVSGYQGNVYAMKVGAGYHFFDGFSLNAEAAGYYLDIDANNGDPDGEAGGGGLDLIVRYHFIREKDWSFYGDLGAGFIESSKSFPADGTNFNFTPQAGLGVTWRFMDQWRLMAGARWFHISNARMQGIERNPAFDALQLYAGVMLPF